MSVPMAGRCGALVVLMAISIPAAAQQQMPPTLRERAAKEGHVRTGAIVDYTCCSDLTELVKHSDIIVRGRSQILRLDCRTTRGGSGRTIQSTFKRFTSRLGTSSLFQARKYK